MLHPKRRILPAPLDTGSNDVAALIDTYFNAYNAARLREACQTFARMIDEGATIGLSISGALTPAGLSSVLVPLIQKGFVDYVSSTGANLYHDLHFDLGLPLYRGGSEVASGALDVKLRKEGIIRVYDVLFPADVLYKTDEWVYRVMMAPEFGKRMSGAELHHRIGRYALETARKVGVAKPSLLAICHENDVPVWVASPGDSTIGLNLSAIHTADPERGPHVDPGADVMEMSAVVLDAKRHEGGLSGVLILGGGAPKNFLLQTEPQLQEILGVAEKGHDFFIQITDARPDTGGLSGATPNEAVSWGKIDPEKLPDTVVCYLDSTIALPLMASYVLARCKPRKLRRLYTKLPALCESLRGEYRKTELYARHWGKPAAATKAGPPAVKPAKTATKTTAKPAAKPAKTTPPNKKPAPKRTRS
jgi:deoxyhypusine synthase